MKKAFPKITLFNFLLFSCVVCQIALTTYFTVFEGKQHMCVDTSWQYLKVIVAAKEGVLFPSDFVNCTTQPEFEKLILAVPLYKIFGNIFLSFGITNLIINLITVFLIYKIGKNYKFSTSTILIIINLFECPFLASGYSIYNDLGYYECVNVCGAHYNILIMSVFLILLFFSMDDNNKNISKVGIVTFIVVAYVTMCKGTGLALWMGVPIVVYLLARVFLENDFGILKKGKSIFLLAFVVAMILGRFIGSALGFEYLDAGTNWVTSEQFFKNMGNIIVGYWVLLGGVPENQIIRPVASFTGLVFCFGMIISACLFIALIYWIIKIICQLRDNSVNYKIVFPIVVFLMSTVVLFFVAPYEISEFYSVRYLIVPAQMGFIIIGAFIEDLDKKLIIRNFGVVSLFVSIACMNLYSDYFMAITDNTVWRYDEILESVNKTDAGLVYFWDKGKTMIEAERVIRVVDTNRVYKCISQENLLENFGDYKYYDDSKTYEGPTVLVVIKDDVAAPEDIINQYSLLEDIGDYSLYYCENNPIDIKNIVENYKQ